MRNQVKEKKSEKSKKESKLANSLVRLLNGDFLTGERVVNHLPYLLFLALIALVYIANGYTAESVVKKINRTERETKDARSEYISIKSDLDNNRTQSKLVEAIAEREMDLKESRVPPKKIVVSEDEWEN